MTADVKECFRKKIEKRKPPKAEPMVDGKSGFLYFDKNGSICYSLSGMNPKALQYLMGHSDISVTLNTYTHVNLEDAREEVARIQVV